MSPEGVVALLQQTLLLTLWLAAPILGVAAVVGLLWALFQAVTQLQDQASAFAVKIVCVALVAALLGGWMLDQLERFGDRLLQRAAEVRR